MIGTQLGRWVIDRQLGKGAMGAVYHGHAADAPDEVRAIKVLAPDLARDPVARQRFQRETDLLCQLDHPNIVRFDGTGLDGETVYYVMEYVNGPDCETRLRELKRWAWWDVIDLTIQVTRGLKYAHDQSIVHRDLKPANILLSSNADETDDPVKENGKSSFTAKIADFGVARVFTQGQLTGSGQFIGTALYMAPEQAAGKPATKRSDFYALGCVMYTLLTGRPPFNGTSLGELVHKHQFAQPERPSRLLTDLPHDVDDVVVRLLSKDPAKRPADGSVLLKRLESIRGKLTRKYNLTDTAFRSEAQKSSAEPWTEPEMGDDASGFDRSKLVRAVLLSIGLLIVIGAIGWKLTRPRVTADALLQAARPMMQSNDPAQWDKAWTEFIEPLTLRFPDSANEREIEEFRQKRENYAALRRLSARHHPRASAPRSEAQRFFELGLQRCQAGDIEGGRKIWQALVAAFGPGGTEKTWVHLANRGLAEVHPREKGSADSADVKFALDEARRLREAGQAEPAEAILKAIEELYRNEPGGNAVLDMIRAERNKKT